MTHITPSVRRAVTTGASLAVLGLAVFGAPAFAQTTPQTPPADPDAAQVDDVVVTGFRASLANALNIKRREAGVVDAISAEDIADFPDTNLAESIQRIPGVSIDRDAGEGRSITVRGLSSEFTRTRINGIEAQATTSATDSSGSTNRGRGFDFNVFASELFNNITVRKTASAEVEEGSLGATVDLRTSRPFDYQGFTSAASVNFGYNDLSESWSPRYAVLISDRFFDDQVGVLFSLAYSDKDSIEEGFSSVRWGPANGDNGFQNPAALPGGAAAAGGLFHPRIPRYGRLEHAQKRTGATLSLQYQPTDGRTTVSLDALYSKLDSSRYENFLEAWSLSRNASQGGKPEVDIVQAIADPATGELVYMQLDDMDMRSEQRFDKLTTEYTQLTAEIEHEFGEGLRFSGRVGQSKSDFEIPLSITAIIDRQNTDGYSWDFRDNRNLPLINYGFDVANPANWVITGPTGLLQSEIRISTTAQTNTYTTAEGAFEWDLSDVFTLKAGASVKEYESVGSGTARLNNSGPALPAGLTMANVTDVLTGFGKGLDLPAGSATSWVRPNLELYRDVFKWDCNCDTGVPGGDFRLLGLTNTSNLGSFREVTERDTGIWAQLDWDTELAAMPFRGNVGVRQVRTEVDALGYSAVAGVAVPTPGKNEYDDTLPSINVSLEPFDDLIVRFAAAKVMSRPPVTNLIPVFTLSALAAPNPSASLGNVELEPYRAKTLDLSIEWYFAPESLLSFAYFYKDISTYVQTVQQTLLYSDLTALNPVAFPVGARPANLAHVFSTPTNSPGGPLKGFEISYQQPLTFLPGPLSNFGVQANYTHVESEINYCTTSTCAVFVSANLVNLSPNAWNATLYYDDGKFNARVSGAYRDGYYQQVPAANGGTRGIAVTGKTETFSIDASASYAVTDNLTVTLEGINLNDEPNRQNHSELDGVRDSTYVYHHTGRQVFVGARYKF
ncbi:MAG: TonB-dependent receptor [Brevundimonas sp.]|nr:MAG: TonB-dependent receptor [Brevundimonas sp.]